MDEDADIPLRRPHHRCHIDDREVVHHPQHHGFGEIVRKRRDQRYRAIQGVESVEFEVSADDVIALNRALVRLERFWSDQIRYRL